MTEDSCSHHLQRRPRATIRGERHRLPHPIADAEPENDAEEEGAERIEDPPGDAKHRAAQQRRSDAAREDPGRYVIGRDAADVRALAASRADWRVDETA